MSTFEKVIICQKNINVDKNIKLCIFRNFVRNVNFDRNVNFCKKVNLTQQSTICLHLPHLLPFDNLANLSLLYRKEIQTVTIFN